MFAKVVFVVAVMAAAVVASPAIPGYTQPQAPASYEFEYGVKDGSSGNDFGQRESRDDVTTSGSYHVRLPDGRVLRVTYTVTPETGYVAQVTYEGQASYPDTQ